MNRGFIYYFGKNIRAAARAVLKGGNFLRYYVGFFAGLICMCFPFLHAVLPVAAVRRAKLTKNEGEIPVIRSFGAVESGRSFGTVLLTIVIRGLIFLGGLAVLGVIGGVLYFAGYVIGSAAEMTKPMLLAVIFAAPAAVGVVLYVIVMVLMFAPTAYILDSNAEKAGATKILTAAVETMRQGGKGTFFLNVFVPSVIVGAYVALAGGIFYFIMTALGSALAVDILGTVWLIIAFAVFVAFAPVFELCASMSNADLFADISLDPTAVENRTKGVFIKRCRTNTLASRGLESNLMELFDNETAQTVKPSDTSYTSPLVRKHKMKAFASENDIPDERTEESAYAGEPVQEDKPPETYTFEPPFSASVPPEDDPSANTDSAADTYGQPYSAYDNTAGQENAYAEPEAPFVNYTASQQDEEDAAHEESYTAPEMPDDPDSML